jgi:hypothetical protein
VVSALHFFAAVVILLEFCHPKMLSQLFPGRDLIVAQHDAGASFFPEVRTGSTRTGYIFRARLGLIFMMLVVGAEVCCILVAPWRNGARATALAPLRSTTRVLF